MPPQSLSTFDEPCLDTESELSIFATTWRAKTAFATHYCFRDFVPLEHHRVWRQATKHCTLPMHRWPSWNINRSYRANPVNAACRSLHTTKLSETIEGNIFAWESSFGQVSRESINALTWRGFCSPARVKREAWKIENFPNNNTKDSNNGPRLETDHTRKPRRGKLFFSFSRTGFECPLNDIKRRKKCFDNNCGFELDNFRKRGGKNRENLIGKQ